MWSHLTNLMESTDPANKHVQQLLNDEAPEKEFDLDRTKFSRNYEGSVFMESLNAGAKVGIYYHIHDILWFHVSMLVTCSTFVT